MNSTRILTDRSDQFFYYSRFQKSSFFNSPVCNENYACLFWLDYEYDFLELVLIGKHLIRTGCRYAVCGGEYADVAELAVDLAYVQMEIEGEISEENHVMTTTHAQERVNDIVYWLKMCTHFDHHVFRYFLTLTINIDSAKEQQIIDALSLSSDDLCE